MGIWIARLPRACLGGLFLFSLAFGVGEATAKPIRVRQQQDLAFGTVASSAAQGGTVVINASTGNKTITGGVDDLGGIHDRAEYLVKGEKNTFITITLPASITATAASGPGTATIDTFVSSPAWPATLPGIGRGNVLVGATLHAAAGNAPNQFRDGTSTEPSDVRS